MRCISGRRKSRKRYFNRKSSPGRSAAVGKNGGVTARFRIVSFSTRTSISPVASFGFAAPSGRWATLPVTCSTHSQRIGFREFQIFRAAFRRNHDLGFAVAIAQIDKQHALMIAVRIDPTAKRDRLTDVAGAELAASVSAIQSVNPSANRNAKYRIGIVNGDRRNIKPRSMVRDKIGNPLAVAQCGVAQA